MISALIYGSIVLALFGVAFISKRRFGLLGLSLSAGSLLSVIWGYDVGLIASCIGIPSTPLTSSVVSSLIILLPAVIFMLHGRTYGSLIGRLIGSSLFAVLAFAFLIEPLKYILIPQGIGVNVYNWLVINRTAIIGVGLIVAIVELFMTKPVKVSDKRYKH